ncbi:2-oxo-hepta-3-ene-1,7-dioic acid hydratase [Rhizorhabdus dicambivorans]|nr:2-oxo-hepta-3-ene-1,7-dioic acid hydratase [Rhizorhabdus dicambivorans]
MLDLAGRQALIAELDAARRTRSSVALPRARHPELTLETAYAVQQDWVAARIAGEGRRAIGYKVALTTRGLQRAFGADQPVFGVLLDDMEFDEATPIPMDRFVAPKVEMELCFRMAKRLAGPCSEADAIAAIDWIAPAIEILDSRTVMFDPASGQARSAIDIVADAGGAAGFVVSPLRMTPGDTDLSRIGAVLYHNGEAEDSGLFPLVFGRPERALTWLAGALAEQGRAIEAGDMVLSGSVIKPYPVARGDRFEFDYGPHGTIALRFE